MKIKIKKKLNIYRHEINFKNFKYNVFVLYKRKLKCKFEFKLNYI